MSGTILIDAMTSVDVRTVDFLYIVQALRAQRDGLPALDRLLEPVDLYGFNMIWADGLDADGLAWFAAALACLRCAVDEDGRGLDTLLEALCGMLAADRRLRPDPGRDD